jgi:hypothetical protein
MGNYYLLGNNAEDKLNFGEIAYIRLAIVGPNDEEQHIYFQIIHFDQRQPFALLLPPLSMNWISAWEQAK